MTRKRSSRRPVKKTTKRKTAVKRKAVAKKKPARKRPPKAPVIKGEAVRTVPVAGPYAGEPSSLHITSGTIPPPAP
jgi:hypothetical protein